MFGIFLKIQFFKVCWQCCDKCIDIWTLLTDSDISSSLFTRFNFHYLLQAKNNPPSLTAAHNPNDPFNDDERERLHVEALAKKFENKYVSQFFLTFAFEVFLIWSC